jgi:hypothetical protein
MKIKPQSLVGLIVLLFLVVGLIAFATPRAEAAQLDTTILRIDRMKASTATGGTVCAQWTTTAGTDAKIKVTFPAGFTVNGTAGNWTVTTSNLPLGATAMPGINTATGVSGQTVTFPITDVSSAATLYCFNFAAASTLTTSTAGNDKTGTVQVTTSADAEIDAGAYATAVIADDQIQVSATVPSTFSLSLSTLSQALGVLSTGSVTSGTGAAVTIITNAANGWVGWVKSQNAALNSTVTGDTIATAGSIDAAPSTLAAGTEGYVLDADLTTDSGTGGSGAVTISAEYLGATTSQGGTLSTLFQDFATANGPTDGDVITLIPRAAISGLTQAATDYSDILTVVGAGNF